MYLDTDRVCRVEYLEHPGSGQVLVCLHTGMPVTGPRTRWQCLHFLSWYYCFLGPFIQAFLVTSLCSPVLCDYVLLFFLWAALILHQQFNTGASHLLNRGISQSKIPGLLGDSWADDDFFTGRWSGLDFFLPLSFLWSRRIFAFFCTFFSLCCFAVSTGVFSLFSPCSVAWAGTFCWSVAQLLFSIRKRRRHNDHQDFYH